MNQFAQLFTTLDETNKTSGKVDALSDYFRAASPEDSAWALFFLTGRRLKQAVPTKLLRAWAMEQAGIPDWLFQESYDAVGDLAETIALLLPPPTGVDETALHHWVDRMNDLRFQGVEEQKRFVLEAWSQLGTPERFVWNKILVGAFRVGVSQQIVLRGLSKAKGVDVSQLTERLMGDWKPSAESYEQLISAATEQENLSRLFPFFLAHSLEDGDPTRLGPVTDWQAEWKWDGIRCQVIRRQGETWLWSRGEELITDRFPEIESLAHALPNGTVIDGEILAWADGRPLPFLQLQPRITRKTLTKTILRKAPVVLMAYDLLEHQGQEIRALPLVERRSLLETVIQNASGNPCVKLSPLVSGADWLAVSAEQARSRELGAEGLMLKRRSSPYRAGRTRGDWWKWKVEPYTADAVLTAAQRGSGKRASLYTDYTFSIWKNGELVPFAKAYSGLTDIEIQEVDAFLRKHMREKFGPVRTVEPLLVFELGFEAIQRSTRHKSGLAVRFPRILRWRRDKTAEQADSIESIEALLTLSQATQPISNTENPENPGSASRERFLFDL